MSVKSHLIDPLKMSTGTRVLSLSSFRSAELVEACLCSVTPTVPTSTQRHWCLVPKRGRPDKAIFMSASQMVTLCFACPILFFSYQCSKLTHLEHHKYQSMESKRACKRLHPRLGIDFTLRYRRWFSTSHFLHYTL